MPSWWPITQPEVVVGPGPDLLGPVSVQAPRFVDRDLVAANAQGRTMWPELADVLAIVADLTPLSVYETTPDDITAVTGAAVHCYFFGWGEALIEIVRRDGTCEFAFASILEAADRLIGAVTSPVDLPAGRVLACTLADRRGGVVVCRPAGLLVGDLPAHSGPVQHAMSLAAEDVRILLLARLREPAAA